MTVDEYRDLIDLLQDGAFKRLDDTGHYESSAPIISALLRALKPEEYEKMLTALENMKRGEG